MKKLSPRQLEVLTLISKGHRMDRISEILAIKPETVNIHIRKVREKLGARTNAEAVAIGKDQGII